MEKVNNNKDNDVNKFSSLGIDALPGKERHV